MTDDAHRAPPATHRPPRPTRPTRPLGRALLNLVNASSTHPSDQRVVGQSKGQLLQQIKDTEEANSSLHDCNRALASQLRLTKKSMSETVAHRVQRNTANEKAKFERAATEYDTKKRTVMEDNKVVFERKYGGTFTKLASNVTELEVGWARTHNPRNPRAHLCSTRTQPQPPTPNP